jgi:hypothetical protein
MSTQSIPYCNINTINGEFFSNKKEKYQKDVEDNKKEKKIFSLGFGLNIFFFILLFFIGVVLYNSNKKLQNQNQDNEENKDVTKFVSLWTPGVVISLIIGILCFISMFFTGYKTIKLNYVNEEIPMPAMDDISRPCYSRTIKQYIQPNQNTGNANITGPGVDVSLNTIVTTGANLNSLNTRINDQMLNANTTFTATGLDQLKGVEIIFGSSQNTNTNNNNTNTQNVVSDTTGVGNLSLDTNKTYSNTASGTASSTGNQGPVTVTSTGTPIVTGTSNQGPSTSSNTTTRLNTSSTT